MKIQKFLSWAACAAGLVLASCAESLDEPQQPTSGEATEITVVVPSGTRSVTVAYPTNGGMKNLNVPITLNDNYSEQYGASAITTGKLALASAVATSVNIYDEQGNKLALNVPVKGIGDATAAGNATMLPEDAVHNYVTEDANQTFYHSSGVAMFDDSWPLTYTEDEDYNDVIIDYDIETKYVDMSIIPDQAWREQIKVVMHLRSVGGEYPRSAGLYLESLDTKYIKSTEARLTLGNHNEEDAAKMGITYNVDLSGEHPLIVIDNIDWLMSEEARTATYTNEKDGQQWYVNPRDPAKIVTNNNPLEYTDIAANTFYNVNPGIINTGGDLFTLTVIFKGTDRNELSIEEGQKQIDHFINATMDINKQNFFIGCYNRIIKRSFEIHMKGYNPSPNYTSYDSENALGVAKDASTTYCAADGSVYGFKVPVLTRHAYEKKSFTTLYPEYKGWFDSNGASNTDWYLHPDKSTNFLCCWW